MRTSTSHLLAAWGSWIAGIENVGSVWLRERERESEVFWVGVVFGLEMIQMIGLNKVFFSIVGRIFLRLVRCGLTMSSWFGSEKWW